MNEAAIRKQIKELHKERARHDEIAAEIENKSYELRLALKHVVGGRRLTEDDLTYAATVRCGCGAGLAYAHDAMPDSWSCSAMLLSQDTNEEHDPDRPFAFWSIKSEVQPSAGGATTRPKPAPSAA